jgi:hypothetical protein
MGKRKERPAPSGIEPCIADLNLVPVQYSLAVTYGWSRDRISAATREYRLYLQLVRNQPSRPHVPSADADLFWHEHILCTELYAADCDAVFGRYLHHFPFAGRFGPRDALRQRKRHLESQAALAEMRDGLPR